MIDAGSRRDPLLMAKIRFRWLWWLGVPAAILCLLVTRQFWIPVVAEHLLLRKGVGPVDIRLTRINLNEATSVQSRVGYRGGLLEWDLLNIGYRPAGLFRGQLEWLQADGLRLTWQVPVFPPPLITDPVPVPVPDVPVERVPRPPPVAVDDPDRPVRPTVPVEEFIVPSEVFPFWHRIPVERMQLSRGDLSLSNPRGEVLTLPFDVRMQPLGGQQEWEMLLGNRGFQLRLDAVSVPRSERIRVSGRVLLRERSLLHETELWLGAVLPAFTVPPEDMFAFDWERMEIQFFGEYGSVGLDALSLHADFHELSWRALDGKLRSDGGEAVITVGHHAGATRTMAGFRQPKVRWNDFELTLPYAELHAVHQLWNLEWSPAELRFHGWHFADVAGRINGGLSGGPLELRSTVIATEHDDASWHVHATSANPSIPPTDLNLVLSDHYNDDWIHLSAHWKGDDLHRVRGSARLALDAEKFARIPLPPTWFPPADWVSGALRLDLDWDLTGFLPRANAHLRVLQAGLAAFDGSWKVRGLDVGLNLRLLGYPQTTGSPRITAGLVEYGPVELRDLVVDLKMPAMDDFQVLLAEAAFDSKGGKIWLEPFSTDIREPDVSTVVHIEGLDAEMLREWFPSPYYQIEGRFRGEIPVRWTRDGIRIGHGRLELQREGGGTLRFIDRNWLRQNVALGRDVPLDLEDRLHEALMSGIKVQSMQLDLFNPDDPESPLTFRASGEARTERLVVPIEGLVIRNEWIADDFAELLQLWGIDFIHLSE